MRKFYVVFAVLALISASCKKNDEDPQYSGEISLSSERLLAGSDYAFYGFSFETGKISTYSITSGARPDLTVNHIELNDTITGVYLESSDEEEAFFKNGIYASAAEAETAFKGYREVIADDFIPLAQNVKANQIWTVQTAGKKFAKIWIRELTIQPGAQSQYAKVKIQYFYQPDGSRSVDCGCNE